jgi:putative transposase
MADINFDYHAQFFTAMILEWNHLLERDMPNHIHLIWQIQDGFIKEKIQLRFLKFTGQQLKFELAKTNPDQLARYLVKAKDREYQIWMLNSLSIDLWTQAVFEQKLDYIHHNPLQEKWKLASYPEDYKYSSANFYFTGIDDFGLLTHYAN